MSEHCGNCGSRICNHGNCPECNPCRHCDGGDRGDKFFGYENEYGGGNENEIEEDSHCDMVGENY